MERESTGDSTKSDYFQLLMLDLQILVIVSLEPYDVLRLTRVCRALHALVEDAQQGVWRRLAARLGFTALPTTFTTDATSTSTTTSPELDSTSWKVLCFGFHWDWDDLLQHDANAALKWELLEHGRRLRRIPNSSVYSVKNWYCVRGFPALSVATRNNYFEVKVKRMTTNIGVGIMSKKDNPYSFPPYIYHSYCVNHTFWKSAANNTRKEKHGSKRVTVGVLLETKHVHYFIDGAYTHSKALKPPEPKFDPLKNVGDRFQAFRSSSGNLLNSGERKKEQKLLEFASELCPCVMCYGDEEPDVRLVIGRPPQVPTSLVLK